MVASGDAAGYFSVLGRPANFFDSGRARAYCACSRCGWGLLDIYLSYIISVFSLPLSLGDGPI